MGAEEARLFAREGAKVAIGDILEEDGRRVEAEINESGGDCLFLRLGRHQRSQLAICHLSDCITIRSAAHPRQ